MSGGGLDELRGPRDVQFTAGLYGTPDCRCAGVIKWEQKGGFFICDSIHGFTYTGRALVCSRSMD